MYRPKEPIHLFLTGGGGTGKTFTTKSIFQSLVHLHNDTMPYDPLQLKGLIIAYTGKDNIQCWWCYITLCILYAL
jgi:hypothetical protein